MLRPREEARSQRGDGVGSGVDGGEGYHWRCNLAPAEVWQRGRAGSLASGRQGPVTGAGV